MFTFPKGLPAVIAPEGGTSVRVVVSADLGMPAPGTGTVHISVDGGPFVPAVMAENAPNDYEAVFPAVDCGAVVEFFFTAPSSSMQPWAPRAWSRSSMTTSRATRAGR